MLLWRQNARIISEGSFSDEQMFVEDNPTSAYAKTVTTSSLDANSEGFPQRAMQNSLMSNTPQHG